MKRNCVLTLFKFNYLSYNFEISYDGWRNYVINDLLLEKDYFRKMQRRALPGVLPDYIIFKKIIQGYFYFYDSNLDIKVLNTVYSLTETDDKSNLIIAWEMIKDEVMNKIYNDI